MRVAGIPLLLALSLPAAGCVSWKDTTVSLPDPVAIPAEGLFRHEPSGAEFPERVGSFVRHEVVRYDPEGRNVSATYHPHLGHFPVIATVYVYPAPEVSAFLASDAKVESVKRMLARRGFGQDKAAVLDAERRNGPASRVESEESVQVENGGTLHEGTRVSFVIENALGMKGLQGTSLLYVFYWVGEGWIVKYRFSYPRDPDPEKGIQALLTGIPWPQPGR